MANTWPYKNVRLSEALTDAEYTAVSAADAALTGASLTGDVLTVAGQTIDCYQIAQSVRYVDPTTTYGVINRTAVSDKGVRSIQGRATWRCEMEIIIQDGSNETSELIVNDPTGHRLLYVQRNDDSSFTAVVDIESVAESGREDSGEHIATVVYMNSGQQTPKWTA